MDNDTNLTEVKNWKTKTLVIGAVLGAAVGITAAYLFTQKADDYGNHPQITSGDGVRLGLLLLGLVRQVVELGDGQK